MGSAEQLLLSNLAGQILAGVLSSLISAIFFRQMMRWVDSTYLTYGGAFYTMLLGSTFSAIIVTVATFALSRAPAFQPIESNILALSLIGFLALVTVCIVVSRRHHIGIFKSFLILILTGIYQAIILGLLFFGGLFVWGIISTKMASGS